MSGDKTIIVVPLLVANLKITMPTTIWETIGEVCRRAVTAYLFLWLGLAFWLLFMAPPFEIAPAGVGRAVLRLLAIALGAALLRVLWTRLSKRPPGREE